MFVHQHIDIYMLGKYFAYMKKRYQCMYASLNTYMHVYLFVCHAHEMCLYIYVFCVCYCIYISVYSVYMLLCAYVVCLSVCPGMNVCAHVYM